MRYLGIARKTAAILANVSLFLNTFLPFLVAIQPVYASDPEVAAPAIVENTPTPEPAVSVVPTPENTPTIEPTPTSEVTPTIIPTPENTPVITPTVVPSPESTPEATPTIIPTVAPTSVPENNNQPVNQENNQNNNQNPSPTVKPTPTIITTPTPTIAPVIEQTCLIENQSIKDTTEFDWNYNQEKDLYETKEKVKLGVKYIFPQDNNVTVTFKCLPTNDSLVSTLKIKRVKTSDLNLPKDTANIGEYAYDITTDMMDGIFKYDITLPKASDNNAGIVYIEKSIEAAKLGVSNEEIKSVSDTEQQTDSVKALNVDHFTLFIVTNGAKLSVSGSFNGVTQVAVLPSNSIEVDLSVQRTGSSSENDWESTSWRIDEGLWNCIDTSNHTSGQNTNTETFYITAPSTIGTYDVSFRAHKGNSCSDPLISNTFTLTDGITVNNTGSLINPPTLVNNPSDTYALNSVTGNWTAISGGSGYQGVGTTEIRWGDPSGSQKSGLRFTNSGAQSFNSGNTFYLGMLTHMNWGTYAGTAANGATLQITLNFNRPNIPNPVFTYDFNIEETSNSAGFCPAYQISNTPCDDKITFPTSYGTQVVTIGDIQYTLVIDGFVNAYPSGSTVPAFITEEQRENSAFLVGHLSSILVERPEIRLTKKTNNQDVTSAPGLALSSGDSVEWEYIIQNSGNVALTNINLTDNPSETISCPSTTLASGATMTCTATGTAVSGQFSNTATVTGTHSSGTVTASDTSWYFGTPRLGHLIVRKTTTPSSDPTVFTTNLLNSTGTIVDTGTVTDSLDKDYEVVAGTYSVTENIASGWGQTSNTCVGVTVVAGQTAYCTIENKKLPVLTINKVLIGDTTPYSNFSFKVDGGATTPFEIDGTNQIYIVPGQTYNITETDPGSKYHVSYSAGCSGNLTYNQTATCTITNTKYGSLTIVKDANPNSLQSFSFTTSGTGLTNFSLTDDGTIFNNTKTFTNLLPGIYSVTESATSGWDLNSAVCTDGSSNTAINLSAGENITCTFTNTMRGAIGGHKYHDTDGNVMTTDDRTLVSNWNITLVNNDTGASASTITDQNGSYSFTNLIPGSYSLTEGSKSGWYNSGNQSINVTLTPGQNSFGHDFINTQFASILVYKNVDTDGDGDIDETHSTSWKWNLGSTEYSTGTTVNNLYPGSYTISEQQQSGYHITSLVCNNGLASADHSYGAVQSQTITLSSGQNLVCTFTNTRDTGTLIVKKHVINDNGGQKTASNFSLNIGNTLFSGDESGTVFNLIPGNYSIGETLLSGYSQTQNTCNLTLGAGETKTCTVTNDDISPKLTLTKTVVNLGGGQAKVSDFTLKANDTSFVSGITQDINAGTYTLSETGSADYSSSDWSCVGGNLVGSSITLTEGESATCSITNTYIQRCGDGIKNNAEECDKNDLGGLPSTDFSCNSSCKLELNIPKVTICHADDSQKKPYVTNTPDKSADVSGHNAHTGGVWYPGIADHSWGDIIPPFYYIGGFYPGKNWTEGQTIYNNGCQYPSGTINVVKTISNDATNYSDFSFSVNSESPINFENDGSNQIDANVGVVYNIVEVPQLGYEVSYDNCKNISVTKGETKTCTITNTKHAKLTVIKQVDTNNDGIIENLNATDWTWDIKDGDQNIATGQTKELAAGSYTISEDQKDAYRLQQWTCSNETHGTTNSIGITLNPGDDVTCTITNTLRTGNIRVCKVILDGNGNIVDGSVLQNNTFSLTGLNQTTSQGAPAGVIGTTTFVTPLSYSEKLFGSEVNNAVCTSYENLIPGNYYYGPESLPEEFWGVPKYNDGIVSQNSLNDHFYEYSGQLFDADPSNDDQRQTSSDGHIILAADQTRSLIVVNQYQYAKLNVTKFNDFDGDGYQDPGETNLSGWTINLTNQPSAVTNSNGLVTFTDIAPTTYTLSETQKDGWMQTNIICDGEQGIDNDNAHQISLTAGQTLNCKIANQQLSNLTVYKFNDLNGNGQKDSDEEVLQNWMINLTGQTSLITDSQGQVRFNNLVPGGYDLSENLSSQPGWHQTNIYCEDQTGGVMITKPGEAYGHHGWCQGWNDCKDAATCALWACRARGYSTLVSNGEGKACNSGSINNCHLFNSSEPPILFPNGSYIDNQYVDYDWGTGCGVMGVTDIICSNGNYSNSNQGNGSYNSGSHLTFTSGQNKICYIGNQRLEPKTTITKSNNSGGAELNPGNSVEYTINLSFADNSVNNLKVTDLLSNGFKYKSGSYKVYKNGADVTSQVGEPQYHSPGVWNLSDLGQLTPSDVVKLVYTADISTDQQAGKYADLAWSIANYAYDSSKTVLASAGSEGHIDTNFVGTQVAVGGNYQNSVSAEVEQVNHTTGQVLGASTELPGTGAATIWLIISGLLGLVGFGFLKINKKTMLTILLTLLSFSLIAAPVRAETSNLSARLEEPKTPSRIKEIELKYVALDIQGRGVTVNCLKKGPTDSDFIQFSSETLSGANGNASHCSLASAITDNGSYQFKVKAVAGGEETLSNIVSLDYNTSSPGTPIDYRKEQINNCDFKIHFKTADDSGKTVKVELYRSTDSNFSANNESLVVSTNIGSNQEKDILNSVSDCSKNYYYALRAFDNAGNGSGLVGDKVYTTVTDSTTTVTSTTQTSGAIPVSGNNISPDSTDQEPQDSSNDQSNDQTTGQILGSETQSGNVITRHKLAFTIIGIILLAIIIYVFKKLKKGKKGIKNKQ